MSTTRGRWTAQLALSLGLVACTGGASETGTSPTDSGSPDSSDPCFSQPAAVEIGTGDDTFVSLAEGDPVVMVHGPQGGWHMLGSVRVRYTTEVVNIRFLIETEAGDVIADNNLNVLLIDDGDCQGLYPGMYAYIDVYDLKDGDADTPPELLSYERVKMTGTITDQEGRTATDERWVTAVPDPQDIEDGLAEAG